MEHKEPAASPGLFRTTVLDERIGLKRLVWAMETNCPACERDFIYVYYGVGQPDQGEVFMMRMSPCPECVQAFGKAQRDRRRKKRKKSQGKKRKR